MKKICIALILSALSVVGFAQQIKDSVIIYIDNRLEINLILEDYQLLKDSNNVAELLAKFQSHIPSIKDELQAERAEIVNFKAGKELSIEEDQAKSIFLIDGDQIKNTGIRDRAIIHTSVGTLYIIAQDLSKVEDLSLMDCFQKVKDLLPEKSRASKTLFFQCIDGTVTAIKEKERVNSYGDYIELGIGTGANLIKNQLVGDISFKLDFTFNKKGAASFSSYLSTNLFYDFPTNESMNINMFTNLGYSWNRASKDEEDRIFGIEFGYLTSREGEFFEKNTFRFALNASLAKGIRVNPQLFMSDGFKKFYPGIRIGFGF